MKSQMTATATVGLVLLILSACATPYQSVGLAGGYRDVRLAPDLFRVSFSGNGFTSAQRSYDFALLRAADLALSRGFTHIALVDESSDQSQSQYYNEFLQSYQTIYKPGTTLLVKAFCGEPPRCLHS